jgi:hypothetical protein
MPVYFSTITKDSGRQMFSNASPKMLKKYIKADSLEVVEKLTDKYEYFR